MLLLIFKFSIGILMIYQFAADKVKYINWFTKNVNILNNFKYNY